MSVRERLEELAGRYALPPGAARRLEIILGLTSREPSAITAVRDPLRGVDVHVADSLVALELSPLRDARRLADVGSGGGFPGLALAVALPRSCVILVESVSRKCAFLRRAVREAELSNVEVVNARAEAWPGGLGVHDVVTARAVAPLSVVVEYAAPLLVMGGTLVAWKGRRDEREEADGSAAAAVLGMAPPQAVRVVPSGVAAERHLYLSTKVGSTPIGYPRRPGVARKRPHRASG